MNRRGVIWAIVALAVGLVVSLRSGGLWPTQPPRTVEVRTLVAQPDCEPLGRSCRALGDDLSLALTLPADLRPMRTFPVAVAVESPEPPGAVAVEFAMAGMDMGVNRFRLEPGPPGRWNGQATLPICTTGRTDWTATVDADVGARRHRAQFPFQAQ